MLFRTLFFLILFVQACAGSSVQLTPLQAQKQLARKDYKALSDQNVFEVRYNPCPCQCTPYEVKTPSGWRRVVLDFADKERKNRVVDGLKSGFSKGIPRAVKLKGQVDTFKQLDCKEWALWLEVEGVAYEDR
jgi:hypothetical protein